MSHGRTYRIFSLKKLVLFLTALCCDIATVACDGNEDQIDSLKSNDITWINSGSGSEQDNVDPRLRRALPTATERNLYLNTHNKLRRQEDAANMNILRWSDPLADMARLWAERCNWAHGQVTYPNPPFNPIGQNLYVTTGSLDIQGALQNWYDEKTDYDHSSDSCQDDKPCGHYTQLVWDTTEYVGCASANCQSMQGLGPEYSGAEYLVCNYGPAGNYPRAPYTKGQACSKCDSGAFWCDDGLCTTACPASSDSCECKADCRNCGKTDQKNCQCTCAAGWTGVDCSRKCTNYHENCGANPGWPEFWCTDSYSYVLDNCPLMCGLCEAEDPSAVCHDAAQTMSSPVTFTTVTVITALQWILRHFMQ